MLNLILLKSTLNLHYLILQIVRPHTAISMQRVGCIGSQCAQLNNDNNFHHTVVKHLQELRSDNKPLS